MMWKVFLNHIAVEAKCFTGHFSKTFDPGEAMHDYRPLKNIPKTMHNKELFEFCTFEGTS